jgi:hypothetical protein
MCYSPSCHTMTGSHLHLTVLSPGTGFYAPGPSLQYHYLLKIYGIMKLTVCLFIGTTLHTNMLCMGVRLGLSH